MFKITRLWAIMIMSAFVFTYCTKDDPSPGDGAKGQLKVEITDAPVDDANVKAVFVTVAELRVNGAKVDGFSRQTIEISAYQNGATEVLANSEVSAQSYSEITLVLDNTQDDAGNSPGAYVMNQDGTKDDLVLSSNSNAQTEVTFSGSDFTVQEDGSNTVVIDFDLRKAIQREGTEGYAFVTQSELNAALSLKEKAKTGVIKGQVNSWANYSEKVIVYAYKKGSFDQSVETQAQGSSNVTFKNAITSSAVGQDGSFELHFLEAGEYELYFAAYDDEGSDGTFELQGSLILDLITGLSLNDIKIDANATVSLTILVTGVTPL
ncbi:MAG: hypothetical protein DHS20C18_24300 [Saprospiraceae bacterium]|nr:MAG: hypothetical protein DHS20C18_24300 [Saprospiraceae bacterium]